MISGHTASKWVRIQSAQKPITVEIVGPLLPHCRQEPMRDGNIPFPMLVISLSQKNNLNRYVFGVMECWSAGVYKIPSSKHQITNKSQIPILKLPAASSRESSKCKVFIPFYCSSLANPAASYGECARWSIFNDPNGLGPRI